MKRRLSKVLNFVAFNLLFFALYLNFIHKDNNGAEVIPQTSTVTAHRTVLVQNPEQYLKANKGMTAQLQDNSQKSFN